LRQSADKRVSGIRLVGFAEHFLGSAQIIKDESDYEAFAGVMLLLEKAPGPSASRSEGRLKGRPEHPALETEN
jgi:hypothetical protein